ncbi:MAG TPA: hypothetical protein PKA87_12455 [Microthrixaceae bacterium]|nr:hypothetical protein [Microthrixaceae bacterium]HMX08341.1 hypothetical protein [Microthrixaceae bacterium]
MGTAPLEATVVEFDREVGLGAVVTDDEERLRFHSTAISDGTRDIAVGSRVLIGLAAAHAGTVEASPVTPVPGT